jgi:hypothetical protein
MPRVDSISKDSSPTNRINERGMLVSALFWLKIGHARPADHALLGEQNRHVWFLMLAAYLADRSHDPLSATEAFGFMGLKHGRSANQHIDVAVRHGWIERSGSTTDGRRTNLTLTQEGRSVVERDLWSFASELNEIGRFLGGTGVMNPQSVEGAKKIVELTNSSIDMNRAKLGIVTNIRG